MKSILIRLTLLPVALFACAATLPAAEVTISVPDSPMLRFALGKLAAARRQQGDALKQTEHPMSGICREYVHRELWRPERLGGQRASFKDAGKAGVSTKGDSVTLFDDFSYGSN